MLFVFKLYFLIRICFHRTSTMYRCDCDVVVHFYSNRLHSFKFSKFTYLRLVVVDVFFMSGSDDGRMQHSFWLHGNSLYDPSQDLQSITGLVRNGQEVGFLARRSGGSGGHHSFLRTDWTRSQWFVVLCFHIHD